MSQSTSNNGLVLIVEDEPSQMELLSFNLLAEGYDVLKATSGEEGILLFQENEPDLALLDWMLPNMSGLEVCRQIKRNKDKSCHVIMLTARGEEDDKVRGLDMGSDDYIVKPYSIKELLARVRAGIRGRTKLQNGNTLEYGSIVMDLTRHNVRIANQPIAIGPLEFKLLKLFLNAPKRVFSREQLLERLWPENLDVETRTVDVHIGRLRKIIKTATNETLIKTIRGFGYAMDDDQ
jgi:two-component system phosphate regulon response regulator PhoB